MPDPQRLLTFIQNRLDEFLDARTTILARVAHEATEFSGFSREFLSGGKRFRARFCHQGWFAVTGESATDASSPIVGAGAALEIFHAAALVHDDIIDNSDTRRGRPSAHRRFEAQHRDAAWAGDSAEYGRSAAILLGDLLLGWSDELLDDALAALHDAEAARSARDEFRRMRTEVTAGQFLDILEEQSWSTHSDAEQIQRAETVATFKSAKYSIEAPLSLGALAGGGSHEQIGALRAYGLPLGIAYQLRDDLLGVFGNSTVTGKPSGDDLREGKRTVLIGLTRTAVSTQQRAELDRLLGNPELTDADIERVQTMIRESGAEARLEERISDEVSKATSALEDAPMNATAVDGLMALADAVTQRDA
ncbi:polyprenyl synthetase family protein [Paramicrobacterium agarici]|uniref:Geranylgeranyl diphosphate synthase type I n=1 Tax=Paramicrobacterium agarici TaxID=630514 RepID=A0A2A9DYR9_9MICO|nr:polyprenyl synthetase family protein [Microbacterium agarici]PFG31461.1 geranylgeranyl diphosphate synthase type I [Microbacterium agarici]TQO21349.1 geranylgeranyl diphosphate synthase type I [Microbacterium agarici]